jgi:hypothetical protein
MTHYRRGWIALVALFALLCLLVGQAPLVAGLGSPGAGDAGQLPVLLALDPDQADRPTQTPADPDRQFAGDREAILPSPANGRELVDRVLAEDARQQTAAPSAMTATLQRAHDRQWHAGHAVGLPVARG